MNNTPNKPRQVGARVSDEPGSFDALEGTARLEILHDGHHTITLEVEFHSEDYGSDMIIVGPDEVHRVEDAEADCDIPADAKPHAWPGCVRFPVEIDTRDSDAVVTEIARRIDEDHREAMALAMEP